jgi:hypothetical protein
VRVIEREHKLSHNTPHTTHITHYNRPLTLLIVTVCVAGSNLTASLTVPSGAGWRLLRAAAMGSRYTVPSMPNLLQGHVMSCVEEWEARGVRETREVRESG